jgi:A/G-specific adenine glycosylase
MQHPVSAALIDWYHRNGRNLPWRNTRNPYHIWLSEIILQQTRVEQGRPYYEKFISTFPDIVALANSKEEKVLKLWQGLGYYSRARNLHKAAKLVASLHKGVFPSDYESIRALPGVGDYTAAAIASFAYNLSYPVVDGNVYRFLSRLFGIQTPIDSTAGKKEFLAVAQELIHDAPPHDFNQALMEFGALVCTPKNPECEPCIFRSSCVARKKKLTEQLPVKRKKQQVRDRYFHYIVLRDGNNIYLRQRTEKDIWQQLWEFPMVETKKRLTPESLLKEAGHYFRTNAAVMSGNIQTARHQLSHQTLHAAFYEFTLQKKTSVPSDWKKVSRTILRNYAVPRLIDRYLSRELES